MGVAEAEGPADEVMVALIVGRERLMLENKDAFVELSSKGLALGDSDAFLRFNGDGDAVPDES